MDGRPRRTVVYEPLFESEMAEIEPDAQLADECMRSGPEWVLSRDPEFGIQIPNTRIWFLCSLDYPRNREFVIYYVFDEERVIFISVTCSPLE